MKLTYRHWHGDVRSTEVIERRGGLANYYSNGRTIFFVAPASGNVYNAGSEFKGVGTPLHIGTEARVEA